MGTIPCPLFCWLPIPYLLCRCLFQVYVALPSKIKIWNYSNWLGWWVLDLFNPSLPLMPSPIVLFVYTLITNLGLTLFHHDFLSLKFWNFAFQTVVHLINRLLISSLRFQVPYTVFYECFLNYCFLKVFCCACFFFLIPIKLRNFTFILIRSLYIRTVWEYKIRIVVAVSFRKLVKSC